MRFLTETAWDLPHSTKLDVLEEPQHTHLILRFMGDRLTGAESNEDGTYILYGPEEALLVRPSLRTTRASLGLYVLVTRFRKFLLL